MNRGGVSSYIWANSVVFGSNLYLATPNYVFGDCGRGIFFINHIIFVFALMVVFPAPRNYLVQYSIIT